MHIWLGSQKNCCKPGSVQLPWRERRLESVGKLQIQPRDGSRDEAARRCQKPLPPPTQSVLSETRKGKHICLMSTQRISFKPISKLLFGWKTKQNKTKSILRGNTLQYLLLISPHYIWGLFCIMNCCKENPSLGKCHSKQQMHNFPPRWRMMFLTPYTKA